jgi:hypothetical protein
MSVRPARFIAQRAPNQLWSTLVLHTDENCTKTVEEVRLKTDSQAQTGAQKFIVTTNADHETFFCSVHCTDIMIMINHPSHTTTRTTTKLLSLLGAALLIWMPLVTANSGSSTTDGRRWVKKDKLPSTGQDWMSLDKNVEFQPAFEDAARFLAGRTTGTGYAQQFIDGQETLCNSYAQAWRLIGMYIDCNYVYNQRSYRRMEDQQYYSYEDYTPNQACQRMFLWAAYVDVDYEGGGIGEYSYFDRKNGIWDTTACEEVGNTRCAKMDCHLPDTHFKLLGFFKEPGYEQWMEQLFKHEGICVWDDNEYNFMQNHRQVWPVNCIATDSVDEDGNTLYFDTKPLSQGRMDIGLYTDWRCSVDYMGSISPTEVLQNVDDDYYYNEDRDDNSEEDSNGDIYQLETNLATWNDALDVFKVCQPCVAYNLGYIPDDKYNDREGEDEDGNYFDCYDDADYTNVNQCMKFRTHTDMYTATFQDIHMASQQGTIVEVDIMGKTYGVGGFTDAQKSTYTETSQKSKVRTTMGGNIFLLVSVSLLVVGFVSFFLAVRMARKGYLSEPLVKKSGMMA